MTMVENDNLTLEILKRASNPSMELISKASESKGFRLAQLTQSCKNLESKRVYAIELNSSMKYFNECEKYL
ncbi:hypothetical protein [Aeromonas phage phiWae14]|nr:hypothetical protein [Aeromonas phage phiWae14]